MLISPSFIKYGYKGNLFFYDNLLTKKIVGHEGNLGNLASQVKSLKNYMSSPSRRFQYITLLIHNIESPSLANEIAQNCLVQLASSPNIHLVASIDHINSGMLWDISKITLFNFAWHDVTNYSPYTVKPDTPYALQALKKKRKVVNNGFIDMTFIPPTSERF